MSSEPSAQAFRALRASVDALDEAGWSALRAQVASWPDEARSLRWPEDEEALSTRWGSLATAFEISECDAVAAVRALARGTGAQVRALSFFACEVTADAVQRLDAFPNLHTLDLSGETLEDDPAVFEALSTLSLPSLRTLRLQAAHPPVTITETDFWPALTALTLTLAEADALGIAALFRREHCPALQHLALDVGSRVDLSEGLRDSPVVSSLRTLGEVELTAGLADLLSRAEHLSELSVFVIDAQPPSLPVFSQLAALTASGPVGDEGMARLVKALPRLERLDAHQCGLGPRGAAAVGTLRKLSRLVLSMNELGDEGVTLLAPALDGVRTLNLHHTGLGVSALRALAPKLAHVRELHLRGNARVGAEGAAVLATTPMPELRSLWLAGCGIGVEGARALAASRNLAGLTFFDLDAAGADKALVPEGTHALATSPHASDVVRAQFAAWKEPPPKSFWKRLFGS